MKTIIPKLDIYYIDIHDSQLDKSNISIDKGKIIEEGTPREFFEKPKTPRVREFLEKVL